MLDLEIWSFEISSSIFFILYLYLWRIHILTKTGRQRISTYFTLFKYGSRRRRLSNISVTTGFNTLPVWFDFIKLPVFYIIINFIYWTFLLSFRIALMWIIFGLTFIKLIIFHLTSSFYQIDIWRYERGTSHLSFQSVVSFSLGRSFWFNVDDILIYLQWFGWWLAVPDGRQLWELKTCVEETLNGSIRDLRWVFVLVHLWREKGIFYLLIVELLHFQVTYVC